MTQEWEGACQTTFGSRFSLAIWGRTGLPPYFVQVRPRSRLKARHWVNGLPAAVYMATSGGTLPRPNPEVLSQSTTADPE